MRTIDSQGVAARLRTLIGELPVEAAAAQLGVTELALRISLHATSPYPTIDVIVAAAQHFAVDPTWILTGEYDAGTHRLVLQPGSVHDLSRAIQRLVGGGAAGGEPSSESSGEPSAELSIDLTSDLKSEPPPQTGMPA